MTNIEKVKRILDAGHYVKVIYPDGDFITVTSYNEEKFSYIDSGLLILISIDKTFSNCTIEVIQRIPTPYVAGDKVLVLSNPDHYSDAKQEMVGKVLEIGLGNGINYVVSIDGKLWYHFPNHCLAPAFDEDSLSGKEAKVTIDGKEYSVTLKLI